MQLLAALRHVTLEEGSGEQALHTITDRGRSEQPHLQSTSGHLKYDGVKHHHLVSTGEIWIILEDISLIMDRLDYIFYI